MKTLEEINKRMLEITEEIKKEDADVDALTREVDDLENEKRALIEKAEQRKATLERIAKSNNNLIERGKEEEKMEEKKENILETEEYRRAFFKKLQRKELSEAEERAMSTAANSVGSVVPTETQNLIIERVFEQAPLLNEITLLRVNGNVTFSVEAEATEAAIHTEGATLNDDGDVLIPVALSSYEINKYITISKSVSKMSIDAFENWLVKMLSRMIARKITKLIIAGTGTNQPKGVEKANTWGATNSVTVAKTASLTKENVVALEGLLPSGYDANAKFLMSKKTLMTDFRPLQDKGKDDFFVKEGNKYYVEGYEVMLDDTVALHEAYLGDFSMYVGNLSEDVNVDNDKLLSKNSFEYLGSAMFDGKPAIGDAFVKLAKATA